MSKYRLHYSLATVGTNIGNVTLKYGGAPTYQAQYGAPVFKRKYLKFTSDAGPLRVLTHNSIDADSARDNVDVLTAFDPAESQGNWQGVLGRAQGSSGTLAAYGAIFGGASAAVGIIKIAAGAPIALVSSAFTYVAGKQYVIRFNISGTSIKLRIWESNSIEPVAWTLQTTDSAVSGVGSVGYIHSPVSASQICNFNFLSVGTGADSAEVPVSNTLYTAMLSDSNVERDCLVEFSAKGYDSSGSPFTKSVNIYVSQKGFVSKPWDVPANRWYPGVVDSLPTISQKMPTALSGEVVTSFGDLVLRNDNGILSGGSSEIGLDAWTRLHINKTNVKVLLGAKGWARWDFREVIVGRIGRPTTPSATTLAFKIQNLASAFNVPLTTQKFTSGQYQNAYKPVLFDSVRGLKNNFFDTFINSFIEPPLTDKISRTYTVHDGAITANGEPMVWEVSANVINPLRTANGLAITAVNTTTGSLTSAVHGMLPNYTFQFRNSDPVFPGTPPAPFVDGVTYFVIAAGLTTTEFRLSATLGGAVILPTTTTTGRTFTGYGFNVDYAAGTFLLVTEAKGRILFAGVTGDAYPTYDKIYARSELSADFKDAPSFAAFTGPGSDGMMFYQPGIFTCADALTAFSQGTQSWFSFTPDGLMRVGFISLPLATAKLQFAAGDFPPRSIVISDEIAAIDFTKSQITYAPWYLAAGALQVGDAQAIQGKTYFGYGGYGAPSIPLDAHPELSDSNVSATFDLIADSTDRALQLVTLFKQRLGIYTVPLRLRAIEASIGDTIKLTDDRLGWRAWAANEASPDNATALDSQYAVVVGSTINLNTAGFPVTLDLMRPMPGFYPTADLT